MKKLLFIVIGIMVLMAGGVYYLLQPKSLGISYTASDLESIYKKLNVTFEQLPANVPANKSLIVSGSHAIDQIFSSEELTAIADNRIREYAYFPFRNVQIRVNADGTNNVDKLEVLNGKVHYAGNAPDIEKAVKIIN